jgi:hypothetical protein
MRALGLVLGLLCLLSPHAASGGEVAPAPDERGTYLGILFGPVAEVLYDQLPQLPRDQGVVVTHILPDSPAATAGLRRHDILLCYGDEKVRDAEHLARLIRDDRPGRDLKLIVLRGGRETTLEATLGRGPALKLAASPAEEVRDAEAAKNTSKAPAGGPVSVAATPLDHGRMKVTIEYYPAGASGRVRSVTCEGAASDIDREVQLLPERERTLAKLALQRIRTLNPQPVAPAEKRPSPSS